MMRVARTNSRGRSRRSASGTCGGATPVSRAEANVEAALELLDLVNDGMNLHEASEVRHRQTILALNPVRKQMPLQGLLGRSLDRLDGAQAPAATVGAPERHPARHELRFSA